MCGTCHAVYLISGLTTPPPDDGQGEPPILLWM